jgi:hypothetical protein
MAEKYTSCNICCGILNGFDGKKKGRRWNCFRRREKLKNYPSRDTICTAAERPMRRPPLRNTLQSSGFGSMIETEGQMVSSG